MELTGVRHMVAVGTLRGLPLFRGLKSEILADLADKASVVDYENGRSVTRQHDRAIALYVLLSGRLQFLVEVEGSGKLLVGVGHEPGLIVGWSVFRAPYRYMTEVRCEGDCRLLRVPHHVIDGIVATQPTAALLMLRRVTESLSTRLEAERERLLETAASQSGYPRDLPDSIAPAESRWTADRLQEPQAIVDFLAHSSLLEGVEPRLLCWLADQAIVKTIAPGDALFEQGDVAQEILLLVEGRVAFVYCDDAGERCVFVRAVEGAGDTIGWSALVDPRRYRLSARALELTHVVALPGDTLQRLCDQEPQFGAMLLRRVLQTIGSRLRFTRVRLVARRYGEEARAIRALIDQSAESLPVTSALYKIPHLLENRLTLADAIHALELTRAHGEPSERDLAEMALEILQEIRREVHFYQGLQRTYEAVANAPPDLPPEVVRRRSMAAFIELFEQQAYRIQGEERLPATGGNVVIMNHLENHIDTMLPNAFRLTLDSHFVSSMILYRHYHEAPVRVVRKPEMGWFGYQQYFDRLDYLYVYPGDVDEEDSDQALTRESRNARFLERAAQHLRDGKNVIIAPEGRCSATEASPGPFKPGAFRLALSLDPEPLIVPIAVANFDKRLTRTTTAAIVFPSFRMSAEIQGTGQDALSAAVSRIQMRFRDYVRQAIELARG